MKFLTFFIVCGLFFACNLLEDTATKDEPKDTTTDAKPYPLKGSFESF